MKKYLIGALLTLAVVVGVSAYSTSGNVHSVVYDAATKVLNFNIRGAETVTMDALVPEDYFFYENSTTAISTGETVLDSYTTVTAGKYLITGAATVGNTAGNTLEERSTQLILDIGGTDVSIAISSIVNSTQTGAEYNTGTVLFNGYIDAGRVITLVAKNSTQPTGFAAWSNSLSIHKYSN